MLVLKALPPFPFVILCPFAFAAPSSTRRLLTPALAWPDCTVCACRTALLRSMQAARIRRAASCKCAELCRRDRRQSARAAELLAADLTAG